LWQESHLDMTGFYLNSASARHCPPQDSPVSVKKVLVEHVSSGSAVSLAAVHESHAISTIADGGAVGDQPRPSPQHSIPLFSLGLALGWSEPVSCNVCMSISFCLVCHRVPCMSQFSESVPPHWPTLPLMSPTIQYFYSSRRSQSVSCEI
jgi:hypothetical protein